MTAECKYGCNIKMPWGWCDQYNRDGSCPCTVCIVKVMCYTECDLWYKWSEEYEIKKEYESSKLVWWHASGSGKIK